MKARLLASFSALIAAASLPAQSVLIPQGGGVSFQQVTFQFTEAQQQNSDWGRAAADLDKLAEAGGMTRGYLNIATDQGWVVQNWELDLGEKGLRGEDSVPAFYFRLSDGPPQILSGIPAVIQMSRDPVAVFALEPRTIHSVTLSLFNAEGVGESPTAGIPEPPVPNLVTPDAAGETFSHTLPDLANVEAAASQSFPMAIANDLHYLENRYGLAVPHGHVPGVRGDQSLVGMLDAAANRSAPSRLVGAGAWFVPMIEGELAYLEAAGLGGQLGLRHQGAGFGGAGKQLPDGDFHAAGLTSAAEGGAVTWDWMCERIQEGCAVAVAYSRTVAAGAIAGGDAVRAYACGRTLGRPWIKIAHDATQGNDGAGLETSQMYVEDFDGDGTLNYGSSSQQVRLAQAECPTDVLRNGPLAPPQTRGEAVVNGATFQANLARSGLTTVFGLFNTVTNAAPIAEEGQPREIERVRVLVDGRQAPVFYADSRQINFQMPVETQTGVASVLVLVDGVPSDLVTAHVEPLAPGIFPINPSIAGPGRGAVQNEDFSLNTPVRPAAPGSAIYVYMSGMGELEPPLATGQAAPAHPFSEVVARVEATIGGEPATVAFAGAAPGYVGLDQVNLIVPPLPPGEHELIVTADGAEANRVHVSVGP
jgi:uncharacterized protein (TIGR03437 family)